MTRRRIVLVYWVIAFGFFVPGAAYAYIDPATTTYLIQIVTALVVTVGVSLSIFMYRFRMVSSKIRYGVYGLLRRMRAKADGSSVSQRETEGDGSSVSQRAQDSKNRPRGVAECEGFAWPDYALRGGAGPLTEEDMAALGEPTDMERIPRKARASEILPEGGYLVRVKAAFPTMLAICMSFMLMGCVSLIIENQMDMPFTLASVLPVLFLATAGCFAAGTLLASLFRGRVYMALISAASAVLVAGYIQGTFLNRGLGELAGDGLFLGEHIPEVVLSIAVWAAAFAVMFLLIGFTRPARPWILAFLPFLLILIQGVGLLSLITDESKEGAGVFSNVPAAPLDVDGMFELASEKNAVILIVDQLDQCRVDAILEEDPHFFDALDGFTMFDDNIAFSSHTFPAITEMLTGKRYDWEQTRREYYKEAWEGADFLKALASRGVDTRLYLDAENSFAEKGQLEGLAGNLIDVSVFVNDRIALAKLLKLSAVRYAPMPVKPRIWMSTYEFHDAVTYEGEGTPYLLDDVAFYGSLVSQGLSTSAYKDSLHIYHLEGSHPPYTMDENIARVGQSTMMEQTRGAMKIVYEFLRQMKGLGLYEDATIIIMADHGAASHARLTEPIHGALFVKPPGAAGAPLAVSHAPVCPYQLPGTVMEGLFGDAEGFGPGYFDIAEDAEATRMHINRWGLQVYEIKGDGRDFDNWKLISESPDRYEQ